MSGPAPATVRETRDALAALAGQCATCRGLGWVWRVWRAPTRTLTFTGPWDGLPSAPSSPTTAESCPTCDGATARQP